MQRYFLLFFTLIQSLGFTGESFALLDLQSDAYCVQLGAVDERQPPASTFKIALSLMGYDAGILQDEHFPLWENHSPKSWMKNSFIWYSLLITPQLGLVQIEKYLQQFDYGNRDFSGGLNRAWLGSSLKISPNEQTQFLKRMLQEELAVSSHALQMTKNIIYYEEIFDGWKLFGKTGMCHSDKDKELGWFVGWIEKQNKVYIFAYNILDATIDPTLRVPRVKQLLKQGEL